MACLHLNAWEIGIQTQKHDRLLSSLSLSPRTFCVINFFVSLKTIVTSTGAMQFTTYTLMLSTSNLCAQHYSA